MLKDILEKLPERLKMPEIESKLRSFITEEIKFMKKRILTATSLNY